MLACRTCVPRGTQHRRQRSACPRSVPTPKAILKRLCDGYKFCNCLNECVMNFLASPEGREKTRLWRYAWSSLDCAERHSAYMDYFDNHASAATMDDRAKELQAVETELLQNLKNAVRTQAEQAGIPTERLDAETLAKMLNQSAGSVHAWNTHREKEMFRRLTGDALKQDVGIDNFVALPVPDFCKYFFGSAKRIRSTPRALHVEWNVGMTL